MKKEQLSKKGRIPELIRVYFNELQRRRRFAKLRKQYKLFGKPYAKQRALNLMSKEEYQTVKR